MARKHVGAYPNPFSNDAATTTYVDIEAAAIADSYANYYAYINALTGTTYSVVLAAVGALTTLSNTSAITVTLPSNATEAIGVGARVDFLVINTGMATFTAGSGATVNGTPSTITRAQWSAVTAIKVATNDWVVVGDLA